MTGAARAAGVARVARVAAQAKINLWLHVGRADASGFHEIFTLFQRIDLADDVVVEALEQPTRSLACEAAGPRTHDVGPAERNLAYRAAVAFQERAGWPRGFRIHITKRIPVGGGLGGGSADAGGVLRALNAMAPAPLAARELGAVAAAIGSDVPFLASERVRAVGTGRGERLHDFALSVPSAPLLLVVPAFGVATADAYRWLDEGGPRSLDVRQAPAAGAPVGSWDEVNLGNHLEGAVEARHPELAVLRESLEHAGAAVARMSGSGSTVFGLFPAGIPAGLPLPPDAVVIRTSTSGSVVPVQRQE